MSEETTIAQTALPIKQLKEIADNIRNISPPSAANEFWLDAAITYSFSMSAGGANLEGWITYYDGTKVHFQLEKITAQTGTAAGAGALPWVRVKPVDDYCGDGTLELKGSFFSASLYLKSPSGKSFTNPDGLSAASAGLGDFHLAGTVKYTKAT